MDISIIAALDEAGGIGKDGAIPWRLPDDLKRFKALTLGHHLIAGRKTFESIGRPLPGRTTILVTRQQDYAAAGAAGQLQRPPLLIAASLKQALQLAEEAGECEVFVIGGSQIYAQALHLATRFYLTRLHATFPCDVFFPPLDLSHWRTLAASFHPADEKHAVAFSFYTLEPA